MSEPEVAGESVAAAAAPKSKAVPIMLAFNTLLVAGVLVFTLTKKNAPPGPAAGAEHGAAAEHGEPAEHGGKGEGAGKEGGHGKAEEKGGMGPTVRLDNFVVQLKAVDAERYAHLLLEVEVGTEEDKNVLGKYTPRIRDAVIAFLADRTADELRGSEGIAKLKQDLFDRLQKIVPGRRVQNLFIVDFIVQ
jgi:flagellar FliL protein